MPVQEIRGRNLLTADDMPYARPIPYRDGVPIAYDGGDYLACLESVTRALPVSEVTACATEYPDYHIGYGLSSYLEATGRGPHETARVRLLPDGQFEVTAGAASAGQGHETTFAQVAAEALGVPFAQVRYVASDTERLPEGVGTFASRSASSRVRPSTGRRELSRRRAAPPTARRADPALRQGPVPGRRRSAGPGWRPPSGWRSSRRRGA